MLSTAAHADVITYHINDILGSNQYTVANTGQTYAGTGYVGMYSGNYFGHLLGLEGSSSRTNSQVDISALAGKQVASAILSFVLYENYSNTGILSITGYNANGGLGYKFYAPTADYGVVTGQMANGYGAKSTFNVTSLVQAAISNNEDWLGMQLTNSDMSRWTYSGSGYATDRAAMQLVVTYADSAKVPEPASMAMVGVGMAALVAVRRKKKHA